MKKITLLIVIFLVFSYMIYSIFIKKDGSDFVEKKMVTDSFELSVSYPTLLEVGDVMEVEATLKYIGDKEIWLEHGSGDMIIFVLVDPNGQPVGNNADTGTGVTTKIGPNHEFTNMEKFKMKKKGIYRLKVFTDGLYQNNKPIEFGNVIGGKIFDTSSMYMDNLEITVEGN